jgi:hypothetical protein
MSNETKHRNLSKRNKKHFYKNFNAYYYGMTSSIRLISITICFIALVILVIYNSLRK